MSSPRKWIGICDAFLPEKLGDAQTSSKLLNLKDYCYLILQDGFAHKISSHVKTVPYIAWLGRHWFENKELKTAIDNRFRFQVTNFYTERVKGTYFFNMPRNFNISSSNLWPLESIALICPYTTKMK